MSVPQQYTQLGTPQTRQISLSQFLANPLAYINPEFDQIAREKINIIIEKIKLDKREMDVYIKEIEKIHSEHGYLMDWRIMPETAQPIDPLVLNYQSPPFGDIATFNRQPSLKKTDLSNIKVILAEEVPIIRTPQLQPQPTQGNISSYVYQTTEQQEREIVNFIKRSDKPSDEEIKQYLKSLHNLMDRYSANHMINEVLHSHFIARYPNSVNLGVI